MAWRIDDANLGVDGRATLVFSADNEQGFDFLTAGTGRIPVDYEGLQLILNPAEKITPAYPNEQTLIRTVHDEDEYVVLDFETTGLDVESDCILEIGALLVVNGEIQKEFSRMITVNVPDVITGLTGITQNMADCGCKTEDALMELAEFIGGRTVVGYNIRMFDSKILKKECARYELAFPLKKVIDVMEVVKKKNIGCNSYKMKDVAAFIGIETEQLHRALPDCRICSKIYQWALAH